MITKCEFKDCSWAGRLRDLVRHCDTIHPKSLREIDDNNCIEFSFGEIAKKDFLLLGHHGLYWFLRGDSKDSIKRGVHAVAGSEGCTYTAKIGGLPVYLGPYKTSTTVRRRFDMKISAQQVQLIGKLISSKSVKLCFAYDENNNIGTHV